jgi:hypothetical protein
MIPGESLRPQQPAASPAARPDVRWAARAVAETGVVLLLLAVAILLQWAAGAYSSEMAHHPDEGAHYITGLMVRDYAAEGFPEKPVPFAQRFYVRFPKIAFGVWPPLFHLILGVWLLPTPDGRASVLVLMAAIMAAAGYLLYRSLRPVAGWAAALLVALLLVLLPLSQTLTDTVMVDSLVMLTELAGALLMARWLRTGANRDALWVGAMAGLACMTKGNGVAAVLAVPLAIVFSRRWNLLRKAGIYWAALIAAVLGLAWQVQAVRLLSRMASFHTFSYAGLRGACEYYLLFLYHSLGWALGALILLGGIAVAGSVRRHRGAWELWTAMGAVALSVLIFHIVIPHQTDGRYLLACIAPSLVFLVPGAQTLASIQPLVRIAPGWRVPLVLACVLAIFFGLVFEIPKAPHFGFREVAQWLESHPLPGRRYLVVSESSGEGGFVAEVASGTDRRIPGPSVMRASKFMFVSDWNGHGYKLVYGDAGSALTDIERMGISYVVVDSTPELSRLPHWDQVREMVGQYPGRLQLAARFPAGENRRVRSLDIYRVLHFADPPSRKFEFQLNYTLGGTVGE